eukprot:gb/GEZN01005736.1/.p1 GENE.gb/GEZN01005736.1/~~gb/GEZN01005736.1/.p1  ORF type:complete len:524 (-),score=104.11 gb/GEZN01005736.1/:76-1647(-)
MAFIAKALFDYEAVEPTELSILTGDRIIVQEQNESGWCLGMKEGTELSGWLPTDYVEKIADYTPEEEGGGEKVQQLSEQPSLAMLAEPAELGVPAAPAVPAAPPAPEVVKVPPPKQQVEEIPMPQEKEEPAAYTPTPAQPKPAAKAAPAPTPTTGATDGKTCDKCKKGVTSAFVVAKERTFHADCFGCGDCGQLLGGKAFIERDGSFYCEECYYKNFNPKCGRCSEIIKGQYISALGQSWHPDHFICTDCGKPFQGNQFHKHENKPYCEQHFNEKFAENCEKCKRRIDGQVFEALDKKYHLECFVCVEGDHQIGEGVNFHVHDSKVYCPQHFEELFLQRCGTCNKMIKGQYVKVLDKHFHPQCWKCEQCSIVITSDNCGQHNGKFYCRKCVDSVSIAPTSSSTKVPELPASVMAMDAAPAAPAAPPAPPAPAASATPEKKAATPPAPAPAPARAAKNEAPIGQTYYSYDALKGLNLPPGVNKNKKEIYLDDATFASLFQMDRAAFEKLPEWKKKRLKQKVNLF